MIKNTAILLFLFFIFGNNLVGQEIDKVEVLPSGVKPRFALVFTPSAVLHPRIPAAQLGGEFNFGEHITFVQEGGFIYKNQGKIINQTGYRIRSEIRFFLSNYELNQANFYVGLQYRNWKFKYDTDNTFCRYDCLYLQRIEYEVEQQAQGLNFTLGLVHPFPSGFQMEWGAGLGGITRTNTPRNIPEDAELIEQNIFAFFRPNEEYFKANEIAILMWIKVGYAF